MTDYQFDFSSLTVGDMQRVVQIAKLPKDNMSDYLMTLLQVVDKYSPVSLLDEPHTELENIVEQFAMAFVSLNTDLNGREPMLSQGHHD